MKKVYVLDTSVFLTDYRCLYAFGKNNIIIPLMVLEEIDKHKKRTDSVGSNARSIIRILDELREKGSLQTGIKIRKENGKVFVRDFIPEDLPVSYDKTLPDNQIIGTALTEQKQNTSIKITLVSCDINMRIKCDAIGIPAQNFTPEHVIKQSSELYSGYVTLLVDDQLIDRFYKGERVLITQYEAKQQKCILYPHIFIMLVSNSNEKKSALCRWVNDITPIRKIKEVDNSWGIIAKNKEQSFALDLLTDPDIPVVSLIGNSGGGKTLLACAAGLSQIGLNNTKTKQLYTRLIVSKPIMPVGRDIGFLPGDLTEKMNPWLGPIQDNLRFLFGDDKTTLSLYMEKGIIEIEAITYLRGRSIQNAFIIIDEVQNCNRHEIKTILTRVGNGSKIVLTGDINQIDSTHIDETSNGLTYAVEKLKNYDISGHITLVKGERSRTATICAEVL